MSPTFTSGEPLVVAKMLTGVQVVRGNAFTVTGIFLNML